MINPTIGKYKITRLIGEGGMASVYEAEHEMLGTKVAIKVLNPILSANAQIKERFRNEARLMASLDHPNITKVIDFDEQPQQLSIVMEYLQGEDLNQKIKRKGPLSEKEITDIFSQTLSAFQYAHEKGIVHRDIKPSNIFILPNGHVKILDFGIAKLFGQGNEMTQTGTPMGTPIYMNPEQVKADKSIDHRSDIYSLGVTMFFAINGKPPYNSDTDSQFDIFNKIVYEPLPEFSIQSKFKDIVLKACKKNREDRFQSCGEFLSDFKLPTLITLDFNNKTILDEKTKRETKLDYINSTGENPYGNQSIYDASQKNKNPSTSKHAKKSKIVFLSLGLIGVLISILYIITNKTKTEYENKQTITGDSGKIQVEFPADSSKANSSPMVGSTTSINPQNDNENTINTTTQTLFKELDMYYDSRNGSYYNVIQIGKQVWMGKNLDVETFRNGDPIPQVQNKDDFRKAGEKKQPAWCYYEGNPKNGEKYGKLYNWYAVNDPRGLAPVGWHIPSNNEITVLSKYLGGDNKAGIKMKSSAGWKNNGNGTNESGFNALPGASHNSYGWIKGSLGTNGFWWTSTLDKYYEIFGRIDASAYFFSLYAEEKYLNRTTASGVSGKSVRCIRD